MPLTVLKSISWLGSVSGASIMIMLAFCVVVIARSSSTCDGGVTCGSGSVKAVDITMVLLDRQHHRIDALAYRIHSWRFRQCASRMSVTHVCYPYFRSFTRQMRKGAGQSQSQLTHLPAELQVAWMLLPQLSRATLVHKSFTCVDKSLEYVKYDHSCPLARLSPCLTMGAGFGVMAEL